MKIIIIIAVLLVGGGLLITGYLSEDNKELDVEVLDVPMSRQSVHDVNAVMKANPFLVNDEVQNNYQHLSNQLVQMEERVQALEARLAETDDQSTIDSMSVTQHSLSVDTPVSAISRVLSVNNLIKAGLDEALASNIVRRKNQLELQKLELRDRAIRENYINTPRYTRELIELNDNDLSLRDELGDDVYDDYLYASGAANRVKAVSVMIGSAAEQAGMQSGDIVLSYDNQAIFDWNALRQATTDGQRGDYVSLEILRNNQLHSLWLPRGPLGIRLGSTRINPGG